MAKRISIKKLSIGRRLKRIGKNRRKLTLKQRGSPTSWQLRPHKRRHLRSNKRKRQQIASGKKKRRLPRPLLR